MRLLHKGEGGRGAEGAGETGERAALVCGAARAPTQGALQGVPRGQRTHSLCDIGGSR